MKSCQDTVRGADRGWFLQDMMRQTLSVSSCATGAVSKLEIRNEKV